MTGADERFEFFDPLAIHLVALDPYFLRAPVHTTDLLYLKVCRVAMSSWPLAVDGDDDVIVPYRALVASYAEPLTCWQMKCPTSWTHVVGASWAISVLVVGSELGESQNFYFFGYFESSVPSVAFFTSSGLDNIQIEHGSLDVVNCRLVVAGEELVVDDKDAVGFHNVEGPLHAIVVVEETKSSDHQRIR
jgi:hypothetical protein